MDRICGIQSEFLSKFSEIQQKSITINYPSEQQFAEMETVVTMEDIASLQDLEKTEFDAQYKVLEKRLYEHFKPIIDVKQEGWKGSTVGIGFFQMVKKYIRKGILTNSKRIDSRGMDDIRTIFCETALIPRAHGCGLFWRGDSQVLSMLTL